MVMGLFDYFFGAKSKASNKIDFSGDMLVGEADVSVLAIVKQEEVLYINDSVDYRFEADKDGDLKFDGRVVNLLYTCQEHKIQILVTLSDEVAYRLFVLRIETDETLNALANLVMQHIASKVSDTVFNPTASYLPQQEYSFRLYKKGDLFYMVNNSQSNAYLVGPKTFKTNDVDAIKQQFWGS